LSRRQATLGIIARLRRRRSSHRDAS
jgi:hypothetical protein